MSQIYQRVALIGLGLIASSMYWSIKRSGVVGEVVGYARSAKTRETARRIGLCDRVYDSASEAVETADLVVLCVPVGVMGDLVAEIAPSLKPGATLSDVGSVKRAVIDAVMPHVPDGVEFVPAHPLAGTEHSGPESGFASLFDNRWCLIVPTENSSKEAVDALHRLWLAMGLTLILWMPIITIAFWLLPAIRRILSPIRWWVWRMIWAASPIAR